MFNSVTRTSINKETTTASPWECKESGCTEPASPISQAILHNLNSQKNLVESRKIISAHLPQDPKDQMLILFDLFCKSYLENTEKVTQLTAQLAESKMREDQLRVKNNLLAIDNVSLLRENNKLVWQQVEDSPVTTTCYSKEE